MGGRTVGRFTKSASRNRGSKSVWQIYLICKLENLPAEMGRNISAGRFTDCQKSASINVREDKSANRFTNSQEISFCIKGLVLMLPSYIFLHFKICIQ